MSAAIWSAIALAGCVWLLIVAREIRHLSKPAEQPAPDRRARLDARIAAERNSARRTAWRMIRDHDLENL
jgi:hypothetical protein